MPSATLDTHGILGVAAADAFLDKLLKRAESVKQTTTIEPPLDKSDFDGLRHQLGGALGYDLVAEDATKKTQRFAVIETAVRDNFKSLIVGFSLVRPGCRARIDIFPRQQRQSAPPHS